MDLAVFSLTTGPIPGGWLPSLPKDHLWEGAVSDHAGRVGVKGLPFEVWALAADLSSGVQDYELILRAFPNWVAGELEECLPA